LEGAGFESRPGIRLYLLRFAVTFLSSFTNICRSR
jgi:hypothetical protein